MFFTLVPVIADHYLGNYSLIFTIPTVRDCITGLAQNRSRVSPASHKVKLQSIYFTKLWATQSR